MKYTEEEAQRLAAEFMAKPAARAIKATYDLATLGAETRQGGKVLRLVRTWKWTATASLAWAMVRYPDGTESVIVSGAGSALAYKDRPVAIVGRATENGDTIISNLQSCAQIHEYADEDGIAGLPQPGYVAPTGDDA